MATTDEVVEQVSLDLGDYWRSTTTAGGSATTVEDDALIDEDDDHFVTTRAQVHMLSGAASGETAGIASKLAGVLTVKTGRDFSAASGSGSSYEVHRLFTRKEKEDAITRALTSIFPTLFELVQETVTIVASQYDYTLTNFNYRLQPTSVTLRSTVDSELEVDLFAWTIKPDDGKLHLYSIPEADRILVVEGIAVAEVGDLSAEHAQILSAWAAIDLVEQRIRSGPSQEVARWERVHARLTQTYRERVAKFGPVAPQATIRNTVYRRNQYNSWRGV